MTGSKMMTGWVIGVLGIGILVASAASPAHPNQNIKGTQYQRQNAETQALESVIASEVEYVDGPLAPLYDFLIQRRLYKFCKLLRDAGLEQVILDLGESWTLFVPTDTSFVFLPGGTLEELQRNPQLLRDFILYHFVAGDFPSSQIQNEILVDSVQGSPLRFNIYGQTVTVSGAQILEPDLLFELGRVYIVDHPLYPIPSEDTISYLRRNHREMYRLLLDAGLTDYISSGVFTLLVPEDKAFNYLSVELKEALASNKSLAERILLNHVFPGSIYVGGITDGMQWETVGGDVTTFTVKRGLTFANDIPIVLPDVSLTNGVILVINRVLLPEGVDADCHCKPSSETTSEQERSRPSFGQNQRPQPVQGATGRPGQSTTGQRLRPSTGQAPNTGGYVRQPVETGSQGRPHSSSTFPNQSVNRPRSPSRTGQTARPLLPPTQITRSPNIPQPSEPQSEDDINSVLGGGIQPIDGQKIPDQTRSTRYPPPPPRHQATARPATQRITPQAGRIPQRGVHSEPDTENFPDQEITQGIPQTTRQPDRWSNRQRTPAPRYPPPQRGPYRTPTTRQPLTTRTYDWNQPRVTQPALEQPNRVEETEASLKPEQTLQSQRPNVQTTSWQQRKQVTTPRHPTLRTTFRPSRQPPSPQRTPTSRPFVPAPIQPQAPPNEPPPFESSRQQPSCRRQGDRVTPSTQNLPLCSESDVCQNPPYNPSDTRPLCPEFIRQECRNPSEPYNPSDNRPLCSTSAVDQNCRERSQPTYIGDRRPLCSPTSIPQSPSSQTGCKDPTAPYNPSDRRPICRTIIPSTPVPPSASGISTSQECRRPDEVTDPQDRRPLCSEESEKDCRPLLERPKPGDRRPVCKSRPKPKDSGKDQKKPIKPQQHPTYPPRRQYPTQTTRAPSWQSTLRSPQSWQTTQQPVGKQPQRGSSESSLQPINDSFQTRPQSDSQQSRRGSDIPSSSYPSRPQYGTNPAQTQSRTYPSQPQSGEIPTDPQAQQNPSQPQSPPSQPQSGRYPSQPQSNRYPSRQQPSRYPPQPQSVSHPSQPQSGLHTSQPQTGTQSSLPGRHPSHPTTPTPPQSRPGSYPSRPQFGSHSSQPQSGSDASQPQLGAPHQLGPHPSQPQSEDHRSQPHSETHASQPQSGTFPSQPHSDVQPSQPETSRPFQPQPGTYPSQQQSGNRPQTGSFRPSYPHSGSGQSQPGRTTTYPQRQPGSHQTQSRFTTPASHSQTQDVSRPGTADVRPGQPLVPQRRPVSGQGHQAGSFTPPPRRQTTTTRVPISVSGTSTTPGEDTRRTLYEIVEDPALLIRGRPVKLNRIFELFHKAGIEDILNSPGPTTVFLPSDDAFALLPRGVVEQLEENPELLRRVLLYHITNSEILPSAQSESYTVPSLEGNQLVVTMLNGGRLILISGAKAVAVTRANNGIFYVINQLLYPLPHNDIVSAIQSRPDLSTLAGLLPMSGLQELLQGQTPYTFLAPTDNAFAKLPQAAYDELSRNATALHEILLNHIIEGAHYGREFLTGGTFPSARGGKLKFQVVSYGYQVNDVNIKTPEIVTGTGVIHLLDQVLLEEPDLQFFIGLENSVAGEDGSVTNARQPTVGGHQQGHVIPVAPRPVSGTRFPNVQRPGGNQPQIGGLQPSLGQPPAVGRVPAQDQRTPSNQPSSPGHSQGTHQPSFVGQRPGVNQPQTGGLQPSFGQPPAVGRVPAQDQRTPSNQPNTPGHSQGTSQPSFGGHRQPDVGSVRQPIQGQQNLHQPVNPASFSGQHQPSGPSTGLIIHGQRQPPNQPQVIGDTCVRCQQLSVGTGQQVHGQQVPTGGQRVPTHGQRTSIGTSIGQHQPGTQSVSHTGGHRGSGPFQGGGQPTDVAELARSMGLNQFANWVTNTGLLEKIHDGGVYTVFAPTDDAVSSLPQDVVYSIQSNPDQVKSILEYHIVPQRLNLNSVGNEETASTLLQGKKIRFNVYENSQPDCKQLVTASGTPVGEALATMGSIQVIPVTQVLYQPAGNLLKIVEASPILQKLNEAVKSARLTWILSGTGPYTIFAPSDTAFESLTEEERKTLIEDKRAFSDLLKRHIVRGTYFSTGIQDDIEKKSENNKPIKMSLHEGILTVNSTPVTYSDITATNGVLHVIDHFL